MMKLQIAIISFICLFSSCKQTETVESTSNCTDYTAATVKDFTGLDGCKWMVVINEKQYEAINLIDFYPNAADGKSIHIQFKKRTDLNSICMAGEMIEITSICDPKSE